MEFLGRPKQQAVAPTRSVIVQVLIATVVGLAVLVAGTLRIIDVGKVTFGGLVMPLVGVFLLVVAVLSGRNLPAARRLDADGVVVRGTIVNKWTQRDADDDRNCYVAYEYGEGNQAFQKVSWKRYRQTEVGDPVDVRYLPEDPALSRLEGGN